MKGVNVGATYQSIRRGFSHKAIPMRVLQGFDPDCPTVPIWYVLVDFFGGAGGKDVVMTLEDFLENYENLRVA